MFRKTLPILLITASCVLSGVSHAQGGDPVAGESKFFTCKGCHGVPGYNNVYPTYNVPRLGGQHPEYIVSALNAYQSGMRKHSTMQANASDLSPQDMQDIAAYVSAYGPAEEGPVVTGNAAAGQEKSQTCVACHGEDGAGNPQLLAPALSGQYEDYLRNSLASYQSGERQNALMNGIVQQLSAQDMADLAAYYASMSDGLSITRAY